MQRLLKIVLPIVILAIGVIGFLALAASKPEAETVIPEVPPPLVRVTTAVRQNVPLTVEAQGTVLPRTETTLAAQVAAEVVEISPNFVAGGFFERGDVLVRLEARDFELAVRQAQARVAQAELRLAQVEADARVAAREWSEIGEGEADPLVLREPQLAEARAARDAAQASLDQAYLHLQRTAIRAPFTGRLREKHVDLGQYVQPGQPIAQVHAIDWAEVRLPIVDRELAYLDVPLGFQDVQANAAAGPAVKLSADFAGKRHVWDGRIVRTEGEIDDRNRMVYLVARVQDPYGRYDASERPPFAVGMFVEAEIAGETALNVVAVPRSSLRYDYETNEPRLLVVDDSDGEERLRYRDLEIVRLQGEEALIATGVEAGERVCISPLDIIVDGMRVRTTEVENPAASSKLASASKPPAALAADAQAEVAESVSVDAAELRPSSLKSESSPRESTVDALAGAGLTQIEAIPNNGAVLIRLVVESGYESSSFGLSEPDRYVIDLEGVVDRGVAPMINVGEGAVAGIRVAQYAREPKPIVRVVFDLNRSVAPSLEETAEGLLVSFPP